MMEFNPGDVMKFELGDATLTRAALDALTNPIEQLSEMLTRHSTGDWGEVDPEDVEVNDAAVIDGDRILSAYTYDGVTFWVITEADRSVTTVLLPEDY